VILRGPGHELRECLALAVARFGDQGAPALAEHVDVNDSILFVWSGHRPEAEIQVEFLEPPLRRDLDRLTWRESVETPQGFSHQGFSQSGSPNPRCSDNSSDRAFSVPDPWLEYPRVGDEVPPLLSIRPAQKVPRLWIATIGVVIGALLLDDENLFAKAHHRVEIFRTELAESPPLPDGTFSRCCGLSARRGRACHGHFTSVF